MSLPPQPSGEPEVLSKDPWPADEFWLQASGPAESLYHFDSLASIAGSDAVDAIVVGRVVSIRFGRPYPDSSVDGRGTLAFEVERNLAGPIHEVASGVINVEFYMADTRLFPRFASKMPPERVLLFLSNKGEQARREGRPVDGTFAGLDYYQIINAQGYLREVDGKTVPTPESSDGWLSDLRGTDFSATVDLVATLRR